jgi:mono/diheme cytochrome c family protein
MLKLRKRVRIGRLAGLLGLALLVGGYLTAAAQTPTPDPGNQGGAADMGASVNLGAQLYAENCEVCHGPNGQGRVGATLAKDWPSIRPDLTVRTIIEQGVPGTPMSAWGHDFGGPLTDIEIEALVAYILSWQTGGAPQITPAPTATLHPPLTPPAQIRGDPNHGAVLFGENCDMCHGPNGAGRVGATLAKDWPAIRPDLAVRTVIANGVPGSPMPAFSQTHGGPLTETEINDLTAFILSLGESGRVVQVSPQVTASDVEPGSALSGWAGLALFAVLFAVIVVGALLLQRPRA